MMSENVFVTPDAARAVFCCSRVWATVLTRVYPTRVPPSAVTANPESPCVIMDSTINMRHLFRDKHLRQHDLGKCRVERRSTQVSYQFYFETTFSSVLAWSIWSYA